MSDAALAVIGALVAALAICGLRVRALRGAVGRLQAERVMFATCWRCKCGRRRYDARTVVADGKGMVHGVPECVPDNVALLP